MTVAIIRPAEYKFIPVNFLESARFYKLPMDANPAFLELLKASEHNHIQVLVKRADEKSDIILSVERLKGK